MTLTGRRIVVGTDFSHPAAAAVDWAAARASRLGAHLDLVLVMPYAPHPSRGSVYSAMMKGDYVERLHRRADERLQTELERVRAAHPEVDVTARVLDGYAAEVLADATQDADLVVVAARGEHVPLDVRALGGTADAVVHHAHGPVAVVTGAAHPHPDGPVVVGVDDSDLAAAALDFAVAEAVATGRPLVALHAWDDVVLWIPRETYLPVELDTAAIEEDLDRRVRALLDERLGGRPGVEAEVRVARGRAADLLVEASRTASLVVVGSRGRGGFTGLLLGSTSRAVLRHADCPVVVVRH